MQWLELDPSNSDVMLKSGMLESIFTYVYLFIDGTCIYVHLMFFKC